MSNEAQSADPRVAQLSAQLAHAGEQLAQTAAFAKSTQIGQILDVIRQLLALPGGVEAVYGQVNTLADAGIFAGSDWDRPTQLQASLCANTMRLGTTQEIILECLNELRLLAIARGDRTHPEMSPEQAQRFLSQVLAPNLRLIYGQVNEAERVHLGRLTVATENHYRFVAAHAGIGGIVEELIGEIWRILGQRPIQVAEVKDMITSVAVHLNQEEGGHQGVAGAERLISALYSPTRGCQEDPGLGTYAERLEAMDEPTLRNEALGFSRAIHDTGLVSPYHPLLLRHLMAGPRELIPLALGLSSTGINCLATYSELVYTLIDEAIWPETAQAVYGLALLLERGMLYGSPVAAALWRQIHLQLSPTAEARLRPLAPFADLPPRVHLLAGVLNVLGQPLGISQGNNPTCQSARAMSLWSSNDPDYLLQVIAWAARDDDVHMRFEGQTLSSAALPAAATHPVLRDVDPVSAVTVPHLDALYHVMGDLCAARDEDPHRWVNPEFHGWWVGHAFAICVDVPTGALKDHASFVRRFYAGYHPFYNGNNPVIHPQPAGIAVTDSAAGFVGWHAISIQRVGLDPTGEMRVYFYNPNNDSRQDWGNGVRVSTEGHGERYGEGSLPFAEFTSRLYIFHYDPRELGAEAVADEEIEAVQKMAKESWARDRMVMVAGQLQAAP